MKVLYQNEVAPALMKKFEYSSPMQIPRLEKVVINVGCGEARDNSKIIDAVVADLTAISGQKPVVTHARKSVANFKLREGMPVGVKVTLRADRMWEFLDRFFNVALLAFVTSAASTPIPSTDAAITPSASRNS